MAQYDAHTKEKILHAAESVFHENGFYGARTTQIAQRAQVSRTMLHYYFRTKEDLFQEVVHNSIGFFLEHAQGLFEEGANLREVINQLIDLLYKIITTKPGLPSFLVNILNESPELITGIEEVKDENIPSRFNALLEKARRDKVIQSSINGEDLLVNIYGLCVTPFLMAPLVQFKEKRTATEMDQFVQDRKQLIKKFVWNALEGTTI